MVQKILNNLFLSYSRIFFNLRLVLFNYLNSSLCYMFIVPTIVVSFFASLCRRKRCKKLSIVIFLSFFKYSFAKLFAMLSKSHFVFLSKYRTPLRKYFDFISTANQNFIPNLSGLFDIYWVKRHLALVGIVMFSPGT